MPTLVIFLLINVLFECVIWVSGREGLTVTFNVGKCFVVLRLGFFFFACLFQGGLLINLKLASLSLMPSELPTYFSLGPRFCFKQELLLLLLILLSEVSVPHKRLEV